MKNDSTKIKPGVKSSEFWLVVIALIGLVIPGVFTLAEKSQLAAIILAGIGAAAVLLYALLRTWLKAEKAGIVDWLTEEQEKQLSSFLNTAQTFWLGLNDSQRAQLTKWGLTPDKINESLKPVNEIIDKQIQPRAEPKNATGTVTSHYN